MRILLGAFVAVLALAGAASAGPLSWMEGTWTGTGSQTGTGSSWSIALTVTPQGAGDTYKIDYPSLNCGGYWTLNGGNGNTSSFTEHIAYGRNKCVDLGTITVSAVAGGSSAVHQMTFGWTGTQPNGSQDYAQATLTKN